jgi:hypothetical protein
MQERTNEQWLTELWEPNANEALADLYDLLVLRLGFFSFRTEVGFEPIHR